MSIADYIESKAQRKQREIKYEIWKMKNHDSRMRAQGALVGAVAGVAAGLLLAPKSGKNLRKDIVDSVDNTINQVKDTTNDFVESAKESYVDLKDRAYTELQPIEEGFEEGKKVVKDTYEKTKANVLSLKPYIDAHIGEKVLTHIDAVPDNFLFVEKDGKEEIRLIDWEYAGMQDPHVDVAMFCIYSLYNKRQVDRLIAAYFTEGCSDEIRIKIYCYIAACGLLWSNWCEYKRNLGVEFGEYSLRQYRYAKDYYRIVQEELKKQGEEE